MEFQIEFDTEAAFEEFTVIDGTIDHTEEIDMEVDAVEPNWIEMEEGVEDWIPEFKFKPGSKIEASRIPKPYDAFKLFFTATLLENILKWSNAEGERRDSGFTPMTMIELIKVFGVQIVMGIKRLKDEKDHWSKRRFLETKEIKEVFPRDR